MFLFSFFLSCLNCVRILWRIWWLTWRMSTADSPIWNWVWKRLLNRCEAFVLPLIQLLFMPCIRKHLYLVKYTNLLMWPLIILVWWISQMSVKKMSSSYFTLKSTKNTINKECCSTIKTALFIICIVTLFCQLLVNYMYFIIIFG